MNSLWREPRVLTILGGLLLLSIALLAMQDADQTPYLADVYLRDGRVLRGTVTVADEVIILANEAGELRFDPRLIERIERVQAEDGADAATGDRAERPGADAPTEGTGAPRAERAPVPAPPLLSERDIQRLKLYEFPADGDIGRARILFVNKPGLPDLDALVLKDLVENPDFGERAARRYRTANASEKLKLILAATGLKYADRIVVYGDFPNMYAFRREVLPLTLKGCAHSGCHGATDAAAFRFPAGSRQTEEFAYTSFLLLDQLPTEFGPLLNRDEPEASVLLSYLVPREGNTQPHPPVADGRRFVPELRNRRDRRYDELVRWIGALRTPHPEYDLLYRFPAGSGVPYRPTSQPATTSAPTTAPDPATDR